jgi:hypothetical protein
MWQGQRRRIDTRRGSARRIEGPRNGCGICELAQNRTSRSALAERGSGSCTMRIYKLPTGDGTYTVYRDAQVIGAGMTIVAADALIQSMLAG